MSSGWSSVWAQATARAACQKFIDSPSLDTWMNIHNTMNMLGGRLSQSPGDSLMSVPRGPVPCVQTGHPNGELGWGRCKCSGCPLCIGSVGFVTGNDPPFSFCAMNGQVGPSIVAKLYKERPGEMVVAMVQFMLGLSGEDDE